MSVREEGLVVYLTVSESCLLSMADLRSSELPEGNGSRLAKRRSVGSVFIYKVGSGLQVQPSLETSGYECISN